VLTRLSKIGGLNVISRTSTLQFRGTQKTMKEIGRLIGADVLLEGSVQKSNGRIRINVQLIDAKNDRHLWAETYDRDLEDVFAIQTDIAKQIAESLNTTLTEKEKSLFEEKPTDNLQAYDLYLDKSKFFIKPTKPDPKPEDYFFNKLAGNDILMQQIIERKTEAEIRRSWEPALSNFKAIRSKYLLYGD